MGKIKFETQRDVTIEGDVVGGDKVVGAPEREEQAPTEQNVDWGFIQKALQFIIALLPSFLGGSNAKH
jgi:hypothetical protein